jgi:hypothetical protein
MEPESKSIVSRGFRFPSHLPAVLVDRNGEHSCVAVDLSRTGALLVGELSSRVEQNVEFVVRSLAGDLENRFVGRVVRCGPADERGGTEIAIEFLDLDPEQKRVLELLIERTKEGLTHDGLDELPTGAPPHVVRQTLLAIPVPHRIALAVRAGPRQRDFLCRDPHPLVLEALAHNPNLLRAEARALASAAHLTQATIEVLAMDPRWSSDDEILIALASHPNVPIPLAERIVQRVHEPALRRLLGRPSLRTALRDKIVHRLAGRHAP